MDFEPLLRKPPSGPDLRWSEGSRSYEEDGERSDAYDIPKLSSRERHRVVDDSDPFAFILEDERRERFLESGRMEVVLSADDLEDALGGPSGDVADRILAGAHDDILEALEYAESRTVGREDVLDAILERRVTTEQKADLEARKEAARKHS